MDQKKAKKLINKFIVLACKGELNFHYESPPSNTTRTYKVEQFVYFSYRDYKFLIKKETSFSPLSSYDSTCYYNIYIFVGEEKYDLPAPTEKIMLLWKEAILIINNISFAKARKEEAKLDELLDELLNDEENLPDIY